jgi:MoxR-like ATPase
MSWGIYKGNGKPRDWDDKELPAPPAWRTFQNRMQTHGATYQPEPEEIEIVNAALYLRRPLLITGKPGIGKSSLAYAVAHELKLGRVLEWSITTRSTLHEGLYHYDAIGRLQEAQMRLQQAQMRHLQQQGAQAAIPAQQQQPAQPYIGNYIRLGPLGTALLPRKRPRVLLIDEIDKSDIDLPNDLLHVFEKGEFIIPELARLAEPNVEVMTDDGDQDERVTIEQGRVRCDAFPFVIFTSNGEREFPPAFLRRCLQITMHLPAAKEERKQKLLKIIEQHFAHHLQRYPDDDILQRADPLIDEFLQRLDRGDTLATDQLLNAIYLVTQKVDPLGRKQLAETILKSLSG